MGGPRALAFAASRHLHYPITEPLCRTSLGLSTDEPWPASISSLNPSTRVYLFAPRPWRARRVSRDLYYAAHLTCTGTRSMKPSRLAFAASFAFLVFAIPGNSCGPFFPEAVFVQNSMPDGPYSAYASGKIGIPQPGYRVQDLVVAYDWLNGHGLSVERAAAGCRA